MRSITIKLLLLTILIWNAVVACNLPEKYTTIIRNGMIYDGNGGKPYLADIGINADTIAFIGNLKNAKAEN